MSWRWPTSEDTAIWQHLLTEQGRRAFKRVRRPWLIRRLEHHNLTSRAAVTDPQGPVVSVTSYGARINTIHLMLESVALGRQRPSRLLLWLANDLRGQALPAPLCRLVRRGLEIHYCPDTGPHKKYFPYVMQYADQEAPLVTADDDHLYAADWLSRLSTAGRLQPQTVHCFRAKRITLDPVHKHVPRPYREWPDCRTTVASPLNFATGASGVLYPPRLQHALREAGPEFMTCCPKADDIWLNLTALRRACDVRQLTPTPRNFYEIPGTREEGLAKGNVQGGGNDRQLAATYQSSDLFRLYRLARDGRAA